MFECRTRRRDSWKKAIECVPLQTTSFNVLFQLLLHGCESISVPGLHLPWTYRYKNLMHFLLGRNRRMHKKESNMLMTVCHSHFSVWVWCIYADNFYAFINSFIFLIDIIFTIVNQTLCSIKNKQLVIEQHGNTQPNQFGECWWVHRQRWKSGTKRERAREQEREGESANEWTNRRRAEVHTIHFCWVYVENRFTVFRDSINIKNIICCCVLRTHERNNIIKIKLCRLNTIGLIGQ